MAFGYTFDQTIRLYKALGLILACILGLVFFLDPWYDKEFCTMNAPFIKALQNKSLCLVPCDKALTPKIPGSNLSYYYEPSPLVSPFLYPTIPPTG